MYINILFAFIEKSEHWMALDNGIHNQNSFKVSIFKLGNRWKVWWMKIKLIAILAYGRWIYISII